MKKILGVALAVVGTIIGSVATSGCAWVLFDEPEMSDSLN